MVLVHATPKSDAVIQEDVIEELRWDTRVSATDIGVEARTGVVTLTGTVDSYAKKLAAAEAAHRVLGVLDVANDINVRLPGTPGRTDTELAQAVRHALEWNVLVPHDHITTTVSNGIVVMAGTVNTWNQRVDAGQAVRWLAGVRDVINNVTVQPPAVAIHNVRQAIEHALERRAEREARDLQIRVEGSTVTVTGAVKSWMERRAIIGAAEHAPGVTHVEDQLTIAP